MDLSLSMLFLTIMYVCVVKLWKDHVKSLTQRIQDEKNKKNSLPAKDTQRASVRRSLTVSKHLRKSE